MYFNTDLLKEAGLEMPAEDWTKDDFHNYAKAMTGLGDAKDSFGYDWTNRLWGSWTPWFFVNDTNLLTEDKAPGGEWLWTTFYKDDPNASWTRRRLPLAGPTGQQPEDARGARIRRLADHRQNRLPRPTWAAAARFRASSPAASSA